MSHRSRLFCLDTVMMDIVVMVNEVPTRGSDVLAHRGLITTGGGFNAMSSATRQGMSVVYAGRLGTGPFSDVARRSLADEGIATPVQPDDTIDAGFCVVVVDDAGERTFITTRGSEARLRGDDLHRLDVRDGDYVLVSGYNVMYPTLGEAVLDWLDTLGQGVVVNFDPSNRVYDIAEPLLGRALARADWLLCNEVEARHLVSGESPSQLAESLAGLVRGGQSVVRHGATGCTVSQSTRTTAVASYATTVIDTNGAGDTHNGVFIAELARGSDAIEAARRANAAASIAISLAGPANCPARSVIDRLVA
ncbi:MAG: sugar kinase [Acidimicrobiaceae bacterium]|nr:sugar kinase [Acidimicrobiaceae bacterium]